MKNIHHRSYDSFLVFEISARAGASERRVHLRSQTLPRHSLLNMMRSDNDQAMLGATATPPSRLRRRRTAGQPHRVLLYTTCYNVIDGYVEEGARHVVFSTSATHVV